MADKSFHTDRSSAYVEVATVGTDDCVSIAAQYFRAEDYIELARFALKRATKLNNHQLEF